MIVVYILTAQPLEADRISMFVLICILTSLVAQSLGLLIGAGLSVESGVFLVRSFDQNKFNLISDDIFQ